MPKKCKKWYWKLKANLSGIYTLPLHNMHMSDMWDWILNFVSLFLIGSPLPFRDCWWDSSQCLSLNPLMVLNLTSWCPWAPDSSLEAHGSTPTPKLINSSSTQLLAPWLATTPWQAKMRLVSSQQGLTPLENWSSQASLTWAMVSQWDPRDSSWIQIYRSHTWVLSSSRNSQMHILHTSLAQDSTHSAWCKASHLTLWEALKCSIL